MQDIPPPSPLKLDQIRSALTGLNAKFGRGEVVGVYSDGWCHRVCGEGGGNRKEERFRYSVFPSYVGQTVRALRRQVTIRNVSPWNGI